MVSWAVAVALLAGCGFVVRLGLQRATGFRGQDRPAWADAWIGLAGVIAYAQVWSLFTGVRWPALLAPAAVAVLGWARAARGFNLATPSRIRLGPAAMTGVVGLVVVWLANLALGAPRAYDSGLYHLGAIGYIRSFGTVPGLANLNSRFGADDAHFLYVALLEGSPWGRAGFHLANGLLVAMFLGDVGSRLVGRRAQQLAALPFTRIASLLSIPAVLATALGNPSGRLSSPSIDLAVLVLFAAGVLYLVEALEAGFEPVAATAGIAMLTAAAATRTLYGVPALIGAGLVVHGSIRVGGRRVRRVAARSTGLVVAVPFVIACGWAVRQAILCGLPFYPATVAALPFDWTLPRAVIDDANRWVASWARSPGHTPDQVLGSWHWLNPWLTHHAQSLNTLGPAAFLVAALPPGALLHRTVAARCRERLRPLVGALGVCLVTLIIWFISAPDPRFVYGPLWFSAIAVLAAILPSEATSIVASLRTAAAVGAVEVAVLAVVGVNVVNGGAYKLVHATGTGPLGSFAAPTQTLAAYTTRSGLVLRHPVGDDRCWEALDCTPAVNALVRARGSGPADGFAPIRPHARD